MHKIFDKTQKARWLYYPYIMTVSIGYKETETVCFIPEMFEYKGLIMININANVYILYRKII